MYSFLKAFLVLMKLLSLSQFYAPKFLRLIDSIWSYMNEIETIYLLKQLCPTRRSHVAQSKVLWGPI